MNPELVPTVLVDKNGKQTTRHVSPRKARKLGLKEFAPVLPPQPDPKLADLKATRAELITMFKRVGNRPTSVREWNYVIHNISESSLRTVLGMCDGDVQRENRVILGCCKFNDEQQLENYLAVMPYLDSYKKDMDTDFIGDIAGSITEEGVFPRHMKLADLKDQDLPYLQAVLKVSAAMHLDGFTKRSAAYDPWRATVRDMDLRALLRERPEAVPQIAELAEQRGPSLTGDVARQYLSLDAKILSEGLL